MFLFLFISFVCLFYLLFISKISSCSTLLKAVEMLFEMILSKFIGKQLIETAPILGPICLTLFIFMIFFISMGIFLSIISESFRLVRKNQKHDQQIFSFMLKRFLRWTGLKNPSALEIAEERDIRMRPQYFHPIERFPEKIDQLLEAIDRIYINQISERSRYQHNQI